MSYKVKFVRLWVFESPCTISYFVPGSSMVVSVLPSRDPVIWYDLSLPFNLDGFGFISLGATWISIGMSFCLFWVGFCGRIIFFFGDETAVFDCVGLTGLSVGDWLCVGEDFEGGGGDRGIKCFPVNGLSISFMLSSVWILFPLLRLVTLRFSGVLVIFDFLKIAFQSGFQNIYGS